MNGTGAGRPWFSCPRPNPAARLTLFCFHYSGGSALVFRGWPARLPAAVEVQSAQLPGHGSRMNEEPLTGVEPIARGLADAIGPLLSRPFAFFGHSMGALVAFELARELRRRGAPPPARLFLSGHQPPHMPCDDPPIHDLPDPRFIAELRRFDGTPQEVLDNAELMQIMTPIMRADFSVCETYVYRPEPPLVSPLSAWGGESDPRVSRDEVAGWREQTSGAFSMCMFPGGHFFLHTAEPLFFARLNQELLEVIGGAPGGWRP